MRHMTEIKNETIDQQPETVDAAISFILCAEETAHVCVNVAATLFDGCLTVYGQDFGEVVEECWGKDEYEYWYTFDRENTEKLFSVLTADGGDPISEMKKHFSGMEGCKNLREFCAQEKIRFQFSNQV